MHVADIEKTIKGYIWTCLPSIFQDICLADPENSESGDRDTCQLLRPPPPPLGPTPKSAHALLLFRQSRFRWQVVLNQETKCRTHSPERVAYTPPPPTLYPAWWGRSTSSPGLFRKNGRGSRRDEVRGRSKYWREEAGHFRSKHKKNED